MNKTYGYARCSTNESKQDINRQIKELRAAGAEEVVFEYEHGDAKVKEQLQMLLEMAAAGDTIITLEVSRLSRSTQQLCEIVEVIKQKRLALCGKQYAIEPCSLARDLSTAGCSPKAWQFQNGRFYLLKGGSGVERELLASQICRCFAVDQVIYNESVYREERVSMCECITSPEYSIVSMASFKEHLARKCLDPHEFILRLDPKNYYMMNIIDYLMGNTDRHMGNWGVLVDNATNTPRRLHDLMDFNQSFNAYDTLEGANCLTTFGVKMTQKDAALQAVKAIGVNQICDVDSAVFERLPQYEKMFRERLALLEAYAKR